MELLVSTQTTLYPLGGPHVTMGPHLSVHLISPQPQLARQAAIPPGHWSGDHLPIFIPHSGLPALGGPHATMGLHISFHLINPQPQLVSQAVIPPEHWAGGHPSIFIHNSGVNSSPFVIFSSQASAILPSPGPTLHFYQWLQLRLSSTFTLHCGPHCQLHHPFPTSHSFGTPLKLHLLTQDLFCGPAVGCPSRAASLQQVQPCHPHGGRHQGKKYECSEEEVQLCKWSQMIECVIFDNKACKTIVASLHCSCQSCTWSPTTMPVLGYFSDGKNAKRFFQGKKTGKRHLFGPAPRPSSTQLGSSLSSPPGGSPPLARFAPFSPGLGFPYHLAAATQQPRAAPSATPRGPVPGSPSNMAAAAGLTYNIAVLSATARRLSVQHSGLDGAHAGYPSHFRRIGPGPFTASTPSIHALQQLPLEVLQYLAAPSIKTAPNLGPVQPQALPWPSHCLYTSGSQFSTSRASSCHLLSSPTLSPHCQSPNPHILLFKCIKVSCGLFSTGLSKTFVFVALLLHHGGWAHLQAAPALHKDIGM